MRRREERGRIGRTREFCGTSVPWIREFCGTSIPCTRSSPVAWRDSMRPVRFYMFDARLLILVLPWLFLPTCGRRRWSRRRCWPAGRRKRGATGSPRPRAPCAA